MSIATAEDIEVLAPQEETAVRHPAARPWSRLSVFAGLFAGLGLAVFGYTAWNSSWPEPAGLIVADPDRSMAGKAEGEGETFVFQLRNPTRRDIRIIGTSDRCSSLLGCSETRPIPLAIPPGESRDVRVLFKAGVAPYHFKLRLFTNDPKQPEILLSFSS